MHVIIVNQYYAPDGAATAQMASDVGTELARAGHVVRAICSDRSYGNPQVRYSPRERIGGVDIDRVRCTSFGRDRAAGRLVDYMTFLFGAVRRLLTGSKPDVIIALTTPPMIAYVALAASRIRRSRFAFWSMDVYPDVAYELGVIKPGSIAGRILGRISRKVLRTADAVIALGETMAELLRKRGGAHVIVVHNWADESAINPGHDTSRERRRVWGWIDRFVVMYSGNLGLAHEFDTLLAAAKRLAVATPQVLFTFVGVGPRLAEVRKASRDLRNVEFHEFVERGQLGETLTAADLHVVTLQPNMPGLLVPSKIYGILAAGRPTLYIGPDEGEVAAIIAAGRCGTVIRNHDVDGVVNAIRTYASDPARVSREGEAARSYFESHFTRRQGVTAFREIIEEIAY